MQKSILITGCSSGIGLCAAETLHKRGYRVFATARKESDVTKLKALGLESLCLDVNDSKTMCSALNIILEKTGGTLDAVFNNAGFAHSGAVEDLSRDMLREQFEINVFGLTELTNLIIPIMRKQGHGRIIQNSSMLGIISMPYRGAYCASKFAVEGLTNALRQELSGTGIFVSIIAPGPIESHFRKNVLMHYQNNLREKESIHRTQYNLLEKYFSSHNAQKNQFTLQPEAVVKKLIHALESKKPKARYYVTFPAHLFAWLRRLLPDTLLDALVKKINHGELKA